LLRLIAWDIGRVLAGLFVLVVIVVFVLSDENPYRMWYSEYFHWGEFAFIAILFSVGFAFLVGGVAALIRRRLAWWVSLLVLLVAGLGFIASGPIGARIYWARRESKLWADVKADPREFRWYESVPAQLKREEAFPLWIAAIERELVIPYDHRWNVNGPDELLADLAARADSPFVQSAIKRAEELQLMDRGKRVNPKQRTLKNARPETVTATWDINGAQQHTIDTAKQHTLEYYQLWLELLSRPDVMDKSRAKNLAEEIETFHASEPQIAALKPKFDALFAASQPGPSR
jgi:hypothetical protein